MCGCGLRFAPASLLPVAGTTPGCGHIICRVLLAASLCGLSWRIQAFLLLWFAESADYHDVFVIACRAAQLCFAPEQPDATELISRVQASMPQNGGEHAETCHPDDRSATDNPIIHSLRWWMLWMCMPVNALRMSASSTTPHDAIYPP
jgi:hypothetical protein